MSETIKIEVSKLPFEEFEVIRELLTEWEWDDEVKYDLVHSSEDENPRITFYLPKESLGDFFGTIYYMGAESIYRKG